jgi:molybdopterin synthase sulfur carrier subunit
MATLRLFAAAREAAGISVETVTAATVGAVLADAGARHGDGFVAVVAQCRLWVNGEPAELDTPVADGDEVAVLPPVSGGAGLPLVPRGPGPSAPGSDGSPPAPPPGAGP